MNFTISKKIIDEAIEFLYSFIDQSDSYLPQRGIYLELDNEKLTLISTSSSISGKRIIEVDEKDLKIKRTGKTLLNSIILKNIIKKFDKEVTFSVEDNVVNIFENKTKYTITQLDYNKYPKINFEDTENSFEISSELLNKVINDVYISTAHSTNNERLNVAVFRCVNISSKSDGYLRFLSTDSYRLSTEKIKINKINDININIDAKNLKKLITKGVPEKINIFYNIDKFGISYEGSIIQTSISKINFIDLNNLLEIKYNKTIEIDKDELLKLINKVVFHNTEKAKKLQFSISKNSINITFEIPEIGISEVSTNKHNLVGKDFEIDVDYQFLKDAVSVLSSGIIKLYITENDDKIYLISENEKDNIQLITPIRKF
ncbi:DNA polymerase III subunit beta [Mycoplasma sp. CSL7491-lung]|uniref:DNA polymerase III subunit beta n=1 Tax=Mycoplasma sp. CSL7491-lung TaxID=549718 RepID=UPI001C12149C|nr:DNA polymerase III subunit beta [Mycoplasma sp. CSL7491-lung]MBU4693263.1 DNA polymerase III subunit beta [Mycoplasma sp. CSL7491-lung]